MSTTLIKTLSNNHFMLVSSFQFPSLDKMTINFKIFYVISCIAITCAIREQFKRRPIIESRIVGGFQTSIESFPYQVSLQKGGSHFCGGVIVRNLEFDVK